MLKKLGLACILLILSNICRADDAKIVTDSIYSQIVSSILSSSSTILTIGPVQLITNTVVIQLIDEIKKVE